MPKWRVGNQAGFTLVEILVALAILAIVALMGWKGLDSIVRSRDAIVSAAARLNDENLFFLQLEDDGKNLLSTATVQQRQVLHVEKNRIKLIREIRKSDALPMQVVVVQYFFEAGKIARYMSAATSDLDMIDKLWSDTELPMRKQQAKVLASGLSLFKMYLWNGSLRKWQPATGPQATGLEPLSNWRGMHIVVRRSDYDEHLVRVFELSGL